MSGVIIFVISLVLGFIFGYILGVSKKDRDTYNEFHRRNKEVSIQNEECEKPKSCSEVSDDKEET